MKNMAFTEEKKKKFKKIFWRIFGIGFLATVLIFFFISIGWIGYFPEIKELQNPINKSATEIYSADMQLLGRFYKGRDNRVPINYSEIDKDVVEALIATEDARFYKHSGIDLKALIRATFGVLTGSRAGGGSTITQQLAKQLYSPSAGNIIERAFQKPIEWVIAVKLERMYSKEEIIAMYLNQFDFLNNAVGIKSAAHVYFNTTADSLKIQEAATLIGMCKNPSYFNPLRHNERTRERRNVVLDQMRKAKYITKEERDSLQALPLVLDYKRVDHKEGLAPYFREYLRKVLTAKKPSRGDYADWQKQAYEDDKWAWENDPLYGFFEKNRKPDGSRYDIYLDGLKIYTTIDARMQQYAEEAVSEHMQSLQKHFFRQNKGRKHAPFSIQLTGAEIENILNASIKQTERYRKLRKEGANKEEIDKSFNTKTEMQVFTYDRGWVDTVMTPLDSIKYHKHFLRCGFMSMDPVNGHVKAYVGGPNYTAFQYDMATLGRRQVGSTIKPFLYTLAMEEGMSPCDLMLNDEITIMTSSGPWTPRNASRRRKGEMVSLKWALTNSSNWVSARLMTLYTPEALVKLIHSFGVKNKIDPVVSLALGPAEISVAEMVGAYVAFPSKGIRVEPLYVTHIEDANGNIIGNFTPKMHEIFSATTAYKMIDMLRSVVDEGTGSRVRRIYGLNMPMGGKTGTTNNNSDGWFMGFTPKLVSGVWVGGEERSIRFDGMTHGQGAAMALPIWSLYMKKVLANKELGYKVTDDFDVPVEWSSNNGCGGDVYIVGEEVPESTATTTTE